MKTFKLGDILVQIALIITLFIILLLDKNTFRDLFFTFYFVIGGWQVISMLIHKFGFPEHSSSVRRTYHTIVTITVLLMPLVFIFWILLFAAPFMALFYLGLCIHEYIRYPKEISQPVCYG